MNEIFWDSKKYWSKAIPRARDHAEYTLMDFDEIEKFQYDKNDFPITIRIRRRFPLLSAPMFSILALFKISLFHGCWKEGFRMWGFIWRSAYRTSLYYLVLGFNIYKLKKIKKRKVEAERLSLFFKRNNYSRELYEEMGVFVRQ